MVGLQFRVYQFVVNKLLLPLLVGCGALLPFTQLQAIGIGSETFGGFAKGKQFKLTITERVSTSTTGSHVNKHAAVPDGMPDFRKGRIVKFTIGKNGRLNGPGFSITYRSSSSRINYYSINPVGLSSEGDAATVFKTARNKPTGATLTFYKFQFSGFKPVSNSVSYVLE